MSKFFKNNKNTIVNECIDGFLYSNPNKNLSKLDIDPYIRIIVRNDWKKDKVAIISGGGSGHEPAHAGFVGKGMLTAAVCGDVFASPSVEAILNAIIAVTGNSGCLLIVKNYTGDRLNFGLAAEKARNLGFNVNLIIVDDDIAIPDSKRPRGIAGTLFIHKIAGYLAEQGMLLEEITEIAQSAISSTASIGVAITNCHLPDDSSHERIAPGCVELGLGIHGEPGFTTLNSQNSQEIVKIMLDKLFEHFDENSKKCLIINNLGGMSALELNLITKDIVELSNNNVSHLVGPMALMTALDMKGFSISCIELNPLFEDALMYSVDAYAWPPVTKIETLDPYTIKMTKLTEDLLFKPSNNKEVRAYLECVCNTLLDIESDLNQLDALVGDGDTGSTFAAGARQILTESQNNQLPLDDLSKLFALIGDRLAKVMGGSSGVLMSIFFTAASQQLSEGSSLAQSLLFGLNRMKHYGGAKIGDRTMIDALQPALEMLGKGYDIHTMAIAAEKGSESTSKMLSANAGRSSYLSSNTLNGIKDPGAVAIEKVFVALSKIL